MTLNISKYPEPDDYGEVLLRLMASPHLKPPPLFPGAETLPGAQPGDGLIVVSDFEELKGLGGSVFEKHGYRVPSRHKHRPAFVSPEITENRRDVLTHLVKQRMLNAICELDTGGILIAASHMALQSDRGVVIEASSAPLLGLESLFCEPSSAYLVSASKSQIENWAGLMSWHNPVSYFLIGGFEGSSLRDSDDMDASYVGTVAIFDDEDECVISQVSMSEIRQAHNSWLSKQIRSD